MTQPVDKVPKSRKAFQPADFPLAPHLDFLRRVWRLNHAVEVVSHRMSKELGLTAQQRFMLRCIGSFPGISPGDVAKILHIDPGTVSSTLGRLEEKGFVQRRRDLDDTRRVLLELTPKGRERDKPLGGTLESAVVELLAHSEAEEISSTLRVLERLAELIGTDQGAEPHS